MAIRTTSNAVEGIIVDNLEDGDDLTPFIEAASAIIDTGPAVGTDKDGNTLDSTRLELIERWLSAHMYHHNLRMRSESEKAGPVSQKAQSKTDLGFDGTHYGQTAMRLDTTGSLAALNEEAKDGKRRRATILWGGTTYSSGNSY